MRFSFFLDASDLVGDTVDLMLLYALMVVWDDSPVVDGEGEEGRQEWRRGVVVSLLFLPLQVA